MANISKIQTPDGTIHNISANDNTARDILAEVIKNGGGFNLCPEQNISLIQASGQYEYIMPITLPVGDYELVTGAITGTLTTVYFQLRHTDGSYADFAGSSSSASAFAQLFKVYKPADQLIIHSSATATIHWLGIFREEDFDFISYHYRLPFNELPYAPTNRELYNSLSAKADASTTYTKTEVDTALSDKVDKVSGKGLSTNDFTDAMQTKLTGIAAGAEVNVQSDWNVTSTSSDAYIKNKPSLGTAASKNWTSNISNSSATIPTSSVVYNANEARKTTEASLLNKGSKNILKITASSTGIFTVNSDGTITINGSTGSSNSVLKLGKVTGSANTLVLSESNGPGTSKCYVDVLDYGSHQTMCSGSNATINWTCNNNDVRLVALSNKTFSNVVIKPMICSTDDWALTTTFVPYAPTNRELYEMIVALGGTRGAKSGEDCYEELTDEELAKQSDKNISDDPVPEK